ncbi:hypothetical protein WJX75_001608 [Coccomyxa subellipsoidea]|uniref:Uncharacterized protein n=1 Tax=Coccomyxa subellipsoidea TaxID=248742 RepID=A0ABR2Z334_9CHLO
MHLSGKNREEAPRPEGTEDVQAGTEEHLLGGDMWCLWNAMGGAQRAAAGWVPGELAAEPNQASSQPQPPPPLPQSPPALNARKPRRDSTARNRAKIAASGMSMGALLGQKAALERELVDLLNRHEELSTDLPWHMHHEEVTFKASIARCMAPASVRVMPVLVPAPNLLQNLMPAPRVVGGDLHRPADDASAKDAVGITGCTLPAATHSQVASPDKPSKEGTLWSSILTFLRLSKPQKDKLAAIYGAHVQQLSELRSECISVASKLQGEASVTPSLATHLACGQLTGIAALEEEIVRGLVTACTQVLNKVQLNNLYALAPSGASAELSLCREVAALRTPPHGAAATKTAPTPPKELTPLGSQIQDVAPGVTDRTGGETGCADIIADVAPLAADVSRAVAVHPMTPAVADSAAAVAASAARRKRRMPDSPRDTEEQPASK